MENLIKKAEFWYVGGAVVGKEPKNDVITWNAKIEYCDGLIHKERGTMPDQIPSDSMDWDDVAIEEYLNVIRIALRKTMKI